MAETVESVTNLPPVRRFITKHNADGKSVHLESTPQKFFPVPGQGGYARSYSVALPYELADGVDIKAYTEPDKPTSWNSSTIVTPNGVNFIIVDLQPGGASFMHQTVSIDYSVVVLGEIEHVLDSGDTVTLKPGVSLSLVEYTVCNLNRTGQDHIIQRGTNHRWRNASKTEPARFVATTIAIEPFEVNGKPLEEKWDLTG
ncbi:hypothetical protein LTR84_012493 [Exophiala bonariae]|uniref:Cupin 2 conserved barrel domain-containing protein n=1 Tax=Exophiala bonariae TaxID=1690606 RepID=A0AAV9NFF1_9EURO|nr:hypothetical protein LTR84_012493 [Exophiala bonariae]